MLKRPLTVLALLSLGAGPSAVGAPAAKAEKARAALPGRGPAGDTLLPNGWRIAPAGRHLAVGDLPLAMAESPDGRVLVVTNNGYAKPSLTVVDLRHLYVRQTVELEDAWLGLAWHPDGKWLYASGGAKSTIAEFRIAPTGLQPGIVVPLKKPTTESFAGGLSIAPAGTRLFAVHALGKLLPAVDLGTGKVVGRAGGDGRRGEKGSGVRLAPKGRWQPWQYDKVVLHRLSPTPGDETEATVVQVSS